MKKKSKALKAKKKKDAAANMIQSHWMKKKGSGGESPPGGIYPEDGDDDDDDSKKPVSDIDVSPEKKKVSKTVESPTPEILQHIRSMSDKLQRKSIAKGLRVKVRFVKKANINGRLTRRLKWYGGVISGTANGGRKIKLQYDDGTSEVADFPDKDIIIDAENNGRHMSTGENAFIPTEEDSDSESEQSEDADMMEQGGESEFDPNSPSPLKKMKKKKKKKMESPAPQQSEEESDVDVDGRSSPLAEDTAVLKTDYKEEDISMKEPDKDKLDIRTRGSVSDVSVAGDVEEEEEYQHQAAVEEKSSRDDNDSKVEAMPKVSETKEDMPQIPEELSNDDTTGERVESAMVAVAPTKPTADNTSSSSGSTCSNSSFVGVEPSKPPAETTEDNYLPSYVDVQKDDGDGEHATADKEDQMKDVDMAGDDEVNPTEDNEASTGEASSPTTKKRGPLSIRIGLPGAKRKKQLEEETRLQQPQSLSNDHASELVEEPSKKKQKTTEDNNNEPSVVEDTPMAVDETKSDDKQGVTTAPVADEENETFTKQQVQPISGTEDKVGDNDQVDGTSPMDIELEKEVSYHSSAYIIVTLDA